MPKPYSEDLRERVLKVVNERKMTMKAMSEMFSIDRKHCIGGEKEWKKLEA